MDISKLLAADKEKKQSRIQDLPVVRVVGRSALLVDRAIAPDPSSPNNPQPLTTNLLKELWAKDSRLRVDRAKLSSKIFRMMDDPNATQDDRKKLYAQIEGFRPELQSNYDLIQYIEKHGHMPPDKLEQPKQFCQDIIQLKERKQQLIWERDRLRRSLKDNAKVKNPDRIAWWQERLAVADAEYNDVTEKIKRINGAVAIDSK